LGDGIRLHAAALVLAVASGGPRWEWVWIVVLGLAMILYTEEGGVTATIWTDTIQMFVYLAGALVCLVAVVRLLPNGVSGALASAAAAGKLRVIDPGLDLREPYTLWACVIGGAVRTLATQASGHAPPVFLAVVPSRGGSARAGRGGARVPGVPGYRPDGGGVPGPGDRLGAPGRPGRPRLRLGPDGGRVPARRPDPPGQLARH